MGSTDAFRAGDGDRERAVEVIREGYVSGRLTLPEFDERTTAAFAARTWGDLRKLIADLPAGGEPGPVPPPRPQAPRPAGPPPARDEASGQQGRMFPLPVLPVALVWLAATLSLHSPGALIPLIFLALAGLGWAAKLRSGPGTGSGASRPPSPPPEHDPRLERRLWREHEVRRGRALRRPPGGPG